MVLRILEVLAIVLVGVCLMPLGAHLFEMPAKLGLSRDDYFTVQGIYAGWAWFGIAQVGAIVVLVLLAWRLRAQRMASRFAAGAAGLIVASMVAFFSLTFPPNAATHSWTSVPSDWEALRASWESGHATGAILTFLALVFATISVAGAD